MKTIRGANHEPANPSSHSAPVVIKFNHKVKKRKEQNAAPYQAAVQAFLTARFYGTWDSFQYADQDGSTNEFGVAVNFRFASPSLVEHMIFTTVAKLTGELLMTKCCTGCSDNDLQKLNPGHDQTFYEIVNNDLSHYLPFFQACAEKLEKDGMMTAAEMETIFNDMGLSF